MSALTHALEAERKAFNELDCRYEHGANYEQMKPAWDDYRKARNNVLCVLYDIEPEVY